MHIGLSSEQQTKHKPCLPWVGWCSTQNHCLHTPEKVKDQVNKINMFKNKHHLLEEYRYDYLDWVLWECHYVSAEHLIQWGLESMQVVIYIIAHRQRNIFSPLTRCYFWSSALPLFFQIFVPALSCILFRAGGGREVFVFPLPQSKSHIPENGQPLFANLHPQNVFSSIWGSQDQQPCPSCSHQTVTKSIFVEKRLVEIPVRCGTSYHSASI